LKTKPKPPIAQGCFPCVGIYRRNGAVLQSGWQWTLPEGAEILKAANLRNKKICFSSKERKPFVFLNANK
jgi:hypothetical protein